MNKYFLLPIVVASGLVVACNGSGQDGSVDIPVSAASYAAVTGQIGGQDVLGGYEAVVGWPKDIAEQPGHEDWTWGAGQSIFAESPDRIYALQRGELPNIDRPATQYLRDIAPSLSFPIGRLPWRDATAASLPANGGTGSLAEEGITAWEARGLEIGIDARWEHCIVVFDGEGNMIEAWTQWDDMLQRPHFVAISPYDPEKHVWVVDDHKHVIHKFTNDGSELVQSIGTYGELGSDETHFNRPSFMDWAPDGSFYVADGYNGTRVVKFDRDGNYLLEWGEAGQRGGETRPSYWHNVHGIAVHAETGRVFVNDRSNDRIQVFDENGKYLYEWSVGENPADVHDFMITADGFLWAADRGTNQMVKYDLDGRFLYSWGTWGNFPGGMWGVHGISVDQEGNFYVAEVDNGGFQKYRPRGNANPDYLVGPPVRSAWE